MQAMIEVSTLDQLASSASKILDYTGDNVATMPAWLPSVVSLFSVACASLVYDSMQGATLQAILEST